METRDGRVILATLARRVSRACTHYLQVTCFNAFVPVPSPFCYPRNKSWKDANDLIILFVARPIASSNRPPS